MARLDGSGEVRRIRLTPPKSWNTRDPIVGMPPDDAIVLDDLIPETDGLKIRPGYTQHVPLTGTWVTSLVDWFALGSERFIATIFNTPGYDTFDITTGTATSIMTGSGGNWKTAQLAKVLGMVNGSDQPTRLSYVNGAVQRQDMAITGVSNPQDFSQIAIFKSRSYFAKGDEPAFWYSEVGALGGSLTKFPIDRVTQTGGNIIDITSWTRDGGSGPDDFFVLFLDTGEVVVYQGSNPGDASDWALVGLYQLGTVLATTSFAGKIHAVTDFDYNIVPDDLISSGFRRPTKFAGVAKEVTSQYGGAWQILVDPSRGWRIINIPSNTRQQHIFNLRTGGGARTHYPANVWSVFRGELYFGGNGAVNKIGGTADAGSAISWSLKQSYINSGRDIFVERYRPIWTTPGDFTYGSGLSYDYDGAEFIQSATTSAEGSPWDTSAWDSSGWVVGGQTKNEWQLGLGRGTAVSLLMQGSSTTGGTYQGADFEVR